MQGQGTKIKSTLDSWILYKVKISQRYFQLLLKGRDTDDDIDPETLLHCSPS